MPRLPMWTITKEFTFDASHRLPHHGGKCRNLHGHTYRPTSLIAAGPEVAQKRMYTRNWINMKQGSLVICAIQYTHDQNIPRFELCVE